ncbi:stage III sporulation protein AD [Tissierella praeacuta]|uniref:Stage III sporulation protein AD n=1 Tax=Tissierella praeacuta DSM 18095 TaxID=1123404 RepID=A0A1M4SD00_9FIRM|nr:stage III sporulation protein AD [Tissierella praeacuta]HAE91434.1 stage III sporulation protein AD [Tissierella sp.]MBU5254886.1 stage III sporulation protein AD [Tissierella praeacuta]TCU72784.1 stage III sporulation protein AD [Tissierella praeacuta]SHE30042.1 stage III sporulation protein AD [Tissierella praeacuta DSM 18095]SUP01291.1 stage III sporulation protein AD [Tissierella praeacuta]
MEIIKIVGIGIVATVLIIILKDIRPEFSLFISLLTGVIIFSMILGELSYVIGTLNTLAKRVNVEFAYFSTILKIIGMAYIVEFGAQISRDAGEEGIAMKIELGGKVLIMVLAIPILLALMELIIKILP